MTGLLAAAAAMALIGGCLLIVAGGRRTPVGPARAYGRVVMTATPGLTWTISCSGQGTTAEEAERNFAFWGLEIDALVASFRFTPAAPQPAPAAAPATTPDKK